MNQLNAFNQPRRMATCLFLGMVFSTTAFAFPCFFTVAKENCWDKYAVRVIVTDTNTHKNVATIDIPQGQSWNRATVDCQPAQQFLYTATFEPSFWEGEAGKVFRAKQYWSLPTVIGKEDKGWEMPICFSSAFAEVPFPPGVSGGCRCDFRSIPAPAY